MTHHDRVQELLLRASGRPRPEWLAVWGDLEVRAACIANRNGAKSARDVLAAIDSGAIRSWRGCGPATVRLLCNWLAKQFPTDPTT